MIFAIFNFHFHMGYHPHVDILEHSLRIYRLYTVVSTLIQGEVCARFQVQNPLE